MNVYDFDKTIYDGDASLDFWKYSVKRQPLLVFYLPYQVFSAILLDKLRKIRMLCQVLELKLRLSYLIGWLVY